MERLQKIIAASGLASRRQAEQLITEGKVRVNGQVITELGTQADRTKDHISVNNRPLPTPTSVTYLLNKPRGYVCSRRAQADEHLVTELVPAYPRVYPVGRLDRESEGLLLLTNDGILSLQLTHPRFAHPKVYHISATWKRDGTPHPVEWISHQLLKGVKLGDGVARADTVQVQIRTDGSISLIITVHEGRNHLLRRMCATLGLNVTSLRRTKFATLDLGHLRPGANRVLTTAELQRLRDS